VRAEWGTSENNRRARFYELTAAGRKQLRGEVSRWQRIANAVKHVLGPDFAEGRQRKITKGEYVSCDYFATIGARIALGRSFASDECRRPGDAPVVVISHDTWQNDLGGTVGVIGKRIPLNRIPFTVIGVAEPGFDGLMVARNQLVGVSPLDPTTYIAIAIVLGGAATFAAYLPSRRAAIVDPARTLRED
jgi:hypothetical protein